MLRKLLVVGAAIVVVPLASGSALAVDRDAQDAYFDSCVTEFVRRNMGSPDAAAAYCYVKAYGTETSGGGYPERTYFPKGDSCFGSYTSGCNTN